MAGLDHVFISSMLNSSGKSSSTTTFGRGKGYLNAGIRWAITQNFMLEINVNDLGKNDERKDSHNRQLKVIYFESF